MFLFLAAARAASFSVPTDHATIEEAIAAAEDGDSITIEQGDWDETLGIGKDLSFDGEGRITGSWTIEGSTVDIADLSFEPAEGRALSIDDATVALSGVSLQGGDAGVSYGGLIFVRDSELILDGCSLSNAVSARGGAIYSYSTDLYVSDTTFSSNQSLTDGSTPARGGAIRSENGTTTLVNSIFSTNSCDYGFGGAVSTYNSDTVIDSCAFTENSVGSLYGGALMVWDADATISDTTFERNSADLLVEGDHASGAAIGVAGSNPGTLSVLRSTFLDNSSDGYGGAVRFYTGDGVFSGCAFSSNVSSSGGAIYSSSILSLDVDTSSFVDNLAEQNGGGIRWRPVVTSASLSVTESTFRSNRVGGYGGAIHGYYGGEMVIVGNSFSGNEAGTAGGLMLNSINALDVRGNLFCANTAASSDGGGVVSYAGGSVTHSFENNLFVENASATWGGGLHVAASSPVSIVNNHFLGNSAPDGGSALTLDETEGRVVNNLVGWQTGGAALGSAGGPTIEQGYNGVYENEITADTWFLQGFTGTEVLEDPLLVDWTQDADCTLDLFYPWGDSPLVDAGDPDIEDPDGSRSDIGAYGGPGADPLLFTDEDGDGWVVVFDCDDQDAQTHPDADEVPYDGIDQDCDGADLVDVDEDGFEGGDAGTDCDDEDPAVNLDAEETWYDGVDQDCDGADDYDQDGDGYTSAGHGGDDCDDTRADVYPGAEEIEGDETDSDCDGERDPVLTDTGDPEPQEKEDEGCGGCGGGAPSGLLVTLLGLVLVRRERGLGAA